MSSYRYAYEYQPVRFPNHEAYLDTLKRVCAKAARMEIATPHQNDPDDELLIFLQRNLIGKKTTNEWAGTLGCGDDTSLYSYRYTPKIFKKLAGYACFFAYEDSPWEDGPFSEPGNKDFAFFDEKDNVIFWTTAHERYACIAKSL